MVFFRIKKIKGKEYAYVVENEWKYKGSRQKVRGYLGKVYRFELLNSIDFLAHFKIDNINDYIEKNEKNKIINDLVEWELFKFGIDKNKFSNKKNAVFFINDGFMCNLTLKRLLDFKPEGDEESDGYRLARAFVEAGVKVPQEVFVGLFSILYKTKKQS